jgi:hypothetical protein
MRALLALFCTSLLVATCSTLSTSSQPSTNRPCTKADVVELVSSFVRAIDAGDRQAIAATLATGVIFSDDRRQVGGDFASPRARDAIVDYFLDRHAAGERFELTRGQANSSRDFEYDLKVSVAQVGTHVAIGKGTTNDPLDCPAQRIAVWNMVRQP